MLTKEQAEKLIAAMIRGKNKPEAAHLRNLVAKMQTNQAHLSLLTLTLEELQGLVAVANREDKAAGHKENNDCLKMLALNFGCVTSGHEVAMVYNQIHKGKAVASGSLISMMVRKKTDALFGKGKSSGRKIFGDDATLPDISKLEEIADEFETAPSFDEFSELVPRRRPHPPRPPYAHLTEASQPSACQRPGLAARPRVAKTSIPSPPSRQMRSNGFEKTSSLKENAELTKHMLCGAGVISFIGGKMTGAPEPPFGPAGGEVAVSALNSLAARSLASTAAPAGALAASPARGPLASSSTLPLRTLPHNLFAEFLDSRSGDGPAVTSEQRPQLQLRASSYDTEQRLPTSSFDIAPRQPQYDMVQPTSSHDMWQPQPLLQLHTSFSDMAPRQPRTLSLEDLAGDGADLISSLLPSPVGPGSTSLLHRLVGGLSASLRRLDSAADSISEAAHAQAQAQAEVPHPTSNSNATPAPDGAAVACTHQGMCTRGTQATTTERSQNEALMAHISVQGAAQSEAIMAHSTAQQEAVVAHVSTEAEKTRGVVRESALEVSKQNGLTAAALAQVQLATIQQLSADTATVIAEIGRRPLPAPAPPTVRAAPASRAPVTPLSPHAAPYIPADAVPSAHDTQTRTPAVATPQAHSVRRRRTGAGSAPRGSAPPLESVPERQRQQFGTPSHLGQTASSSSRAAKRPAHGGFQQHSSRSRPSPGNGAPRSPLVPLNAP